MSELRAAIRAAVDQLRKAGIGSAENDASVLAGLVLGVDVGEVHRRVVLGAGLEDSAAERYRELLADRAERIPLQHLTGVAHFRTITVAVGPGVFVPRPETEVLVEHALRVLHGSSAPRVLDLCTGSAAIALAVAVEHPGARVGAVELDPQAHAWAMRNLANVGAERGVEVDLRLGSALEAFTELDGQIDLVVSNPPYIPDGMVPQDPEVQDHDPELALYGGGDDGLLMPRQVVERASALLRPGGTVLMEHADTQGDLLVAELAADRRWELVRDHRDLTGRPRVLAAVRSND